MRYPKWFARWRLQVWDNRLTDWRKAWDEEETLDYESLVTLALINRTKWLKRVKG